MFVKKTLGCLTAASLSFAVAGAPLLAQDAQSTFTLDLNTAADTEQGGCRLTYVASNNTGQALSAVSYQVGVFDAQGIVTDLVVLQFGELIEGKTKIVQFELGGRACADISRITVNEVAQCSLADGTDAGFCMTSLETGSRSAIQFGI